MKPHMSWAEELLASWGGYVRSWAQSQGNLHRMSRDLFDLSDALTQRAPGTHGNPVLSNLLAEEAAKLTFMSSMDLCIIQYPVVWLRMIVPRFVGIPDETAENGWRFATWSEIEATINLPERDRKACMYQVRQQIEYDARQILAKANAQRIAA